MAAPTPDSSHAIWLGLKLYELLTLLGIVIGPITAVLITIVYERLRRRREEQIETLRLLLSTRMTPADPGWNRAIALVPVEFRTNSAVIAKWREYLTVVNTMVTAEQEQEQIRRSIVAQIALIYEIGKSLGLPISEGDLQSTAYISRGFTDREQLYTGSLIATIAIAESTRRSADASEMLVARLGPEA